MTAITRWLSDEAYQKMPLRCCGGDHEPDPPETRLAYEGWEFGPPFKCMCCGKDTCARQFAFGRTCGPCDMGACDRHNRAFKKKYAHGHPSFWLNYGHSREEKLEAFALQSGITAERLP